MAKMTDMMVVGVDDNDTIVHTRANKLPVTVEIVVPFRRALMFSILFMSSRSLCTFSSDVVDDVDVDRTGDGDVDDA